jgi:hypothetical protein
MTKYDELLEKALAAVTATFRKRAVSALLSGRDGKLIAQAKQAERADDFEMITWLMIKEPQ